MNVVAVDVAALMAASTLVGLLVLDRVRPPDCECDECSKHFPERKAKQERRRALDHRAMHDTFRAADWGDPRCNRCKDGGDKDKFVR